jgi:transcription antitermination factor NusG
MYWYVLYTKSKWEKKVALQLNSIGVTCYCPTIVKVQQWSDRKKKVVVPLFNHYVFVQVPDNDRNSVFVSPGVVRYLFWLGKHAVVNDEEITIIKQWLEGADSNVNIDVLPYSVGETIKIDKGPFINHSAKIQQVTNTHYVLVLESLGCILKMKKL